MAPAGRSAEARRGRRRAPRKRARPEVGLEVVWGNITLTTGDVFVVGHYQGVLPQNAERALDIALSGEDPGRPDERRLILTDLTRRGVLRGALGDVAFFPWQRRRTVLVAGMGRPGTFHLPELRMLARSLTATIGRLPHRPTVSAVMIGSGAGNLNVSQAVAGLVLGIGEALAADPSLRLGRVRLVERSLDRALRALQILKRVARSPEAVALADFRVGARLKHKAAEGGLIPEHFAYSMVLAAVAQSAGLPEDSPTRGYFEHLLKSVADDKDLRESIADRLRKVGSKRRQIRDLALQFRLAEQERDERQFPTRVAFSTNGQEVYSAAITDTVTVAQRALSISLASVERLVARLQAPLPAAAVKFGRGLGRSLIHSEFQPLFEGPGPLVVEVDRVLAQVQWEMLLGEAEPARPLGLARTVARQLRTTYSPRPADVAPRAALHALVIGDPGGQAAQLPDARREAREVSALLRKRGVETTLLIGDPLFGDADTAPAELAEVIVLLLSGEFDLVHYCGHSQSNPGVPGKTGWVFADGLLTAGDLAGMRRPPLLVVANACRSAELAAARPPGNAPGAAPPPADVGLIAAVADEFFRIGVADYIGSAWDVPSEPAGVFARVFYGSVLATPVTRGRAQSLGEAVRLARQRLHDKYRTGEYATTWGAYQHYGDPTRVLDLPARSR